MQHGIKQITRFMQPAFVASRHGDGIAGIPPPPLSVAADSEVAIVAVGGLPQHGGERVDGAAPGGGEAKQTKDDK